MNEGEFFYKYKKEDRQITYYGVDESMKHIQRTLTIPNFYFYSGKTDDASIRHIYKPSDIVKCGGKIVLIDPIKSSSLQKLDDNDFWIFLRKVSEYKLFSSRRGEARMINLTVGFYNGGDVYTYDLESQTLSEKIRIDNLDILHFLVVFNNEVLDDIDVPDHVQVVPITDIINSEYPYYKDMNKVFLYRLLTEEYADTTKQDYEITILVEFYIKVLGTSVQECFYNQQNMNTFFLYKGDYQTEKSISKLPVRRDNIPLEQGIYKDVYLYDLAHYDQTLVNCSYLMQNWVYRTSEKEVPLSSIYGMMDGIVYTSKSSEGYIEHFNHLIVIEPETRIYIKDNKIFWTGAFVDDHNTYPAFPSSLRFIINCIILNKDKKLSIFEFLDSGEARDFCLLSKNEWYDKDGNITTNIRDFSIKYYVNKLENIANDIYSLKEIV